MRRIGVAVGLLLLFGAVDYWTYPLLSSSPPASMDLGRNGIWLQYTWYFAQHSNDDVAELGKRLRAGGFRYACFHVRDAKPDGSLRYEHVADANKLNSQLANTNADVKRVAWFYVGNERGRGGIVLSDPVVRTKLVSEARRLVVDGGFQGIQWDYEICDDGDAAFLALLDESRRKLPQGTWLGAAVPTWYPWPLAGFGWSPSYYHAVAQRCDQIAVMTYDTGMYHPRLYTWLAAKQRGVMEEALANTHCTFVIGLPTYGPGTASHNPRAECLSNGIRAVRAGGRGAKAFEGVALFADYTTNAGEWREYEELWRSRR